MTNYEENKNIQNDSILESTVKKIYEIYKKEPANFKHSILMQEILGTPISYKFSDTNIQNIENLYQYIKANNFDEKFKTDFLHIAATIEVIYNYFVDANKLRNQNDFLNQSLDTQLRILIMYVEDQQRMAQDVNNQFSQNTVSSLVHLTSYATSTLDPRNKYSVTTNTEHLLDITNELIPYLLYLNEQTERQKDYKPMLCHLDVPNFESFIYLSSIHTGLKQCWDAYKYEDYTLLLHHKEKCGAFIPENMLSSQVHYIAAVRRESRQVQGTLKYMSSHKEIAMNAQKEIHNISNSFTLNSWINIFEIEAVIYNICRNYVHLYIDYLKSDIIPQILDIPFLNGNLYDILDTYEFLYTMSLIYQDILNIEWDSNNKTQYIYLCPNVSLGIVAQSYSRLYHKTYEHALSLLQCFVYNNKRNKESDLFSTPLVQLQKGDILFAPHLIQQLNINRKLEHIMLDYKMQRSKIGKIYEAQLRTILHFFPYWNVYPYELNFKSSLGDTDFDILALMDNYLFVIEIKHLIVPYDAKRYYSDKKEIKKAVSQLKQRINVLQNDWNKIRELTKGFLPKEKIPRDKIIPLICTNIEDYTSLHYDNIMIIDESSLIRFFEKGSIQIKTNEKIIRHESIWKGSKPTVQDLLTYIQNPIAVKWLKEIVQSKVVYFPRLPENEPLGILNHELDYEKYEHLFLGQ